MPRLLDRRGFSLHTDAVKSRYLILYALGPLSFLLQAQDKPLPDLAVVEQKVNNSYYHPVGIESLSCDLRPNWDELFHVANMSPEDESAIHLRNSTFHIQSGPKIPLTFSETWAKDTPEDFIHGFGAKEAAAYRQMVGGVFTSYWAVMDTTPAPAEANVHIGKAKDESLILLSSYKNVESETDLTADFLPVHSKSKALVQSTELNLGFIPSPSPAIGDRFRLRMIEATQTIGINSTTGHIEMDDQNVDGFHLPKTVSVSVPGAFLLSFELTNCTVRRIGDPPQKPEVTTTQTIHLPKKILPRAK